jgi:hypothetical protein
MEGKNTAREVLALAETSCGGTRREITIENIMHRRLSGSAHTAYFAPVLRRDVVLC